MVKFVGLILLGFAACMAAAIPPTEDPNGHPRIRRSSWNPNPSGSISSVPVASVKVPHNDHSDTVQLNSDGSTVRIHDTNHNHDHGHYSGFNSGNYPGFNSGNYPGFNSGNYPGFNSGNYPGFNSEHFHPEHVPGHAKPVAEMTKIGKDEYGHDVAVHENIYPDGHKHQLVQHLR